MLSASILLMFAIACFALAATPGPDMLLIVSQSAGHGRGAGFATLAGIMSGTYCHALAAAFGLSQLFLAVPLAYDVVRFLGAGYLLYLAWKTVRGAGHAPEAGPAAPRRSLARLYRQGLFTNLLNPKMALFVLALFPQFVQPQAGSVAAQILLLATVLNVIGLLVNGAVIFAASALAGRIASRRRPSRLPHYLLGGVFAGLACRLALSARQ